MGTLEIIITIGTLIILPLIGLLWKNLNDKVLSNAAKIDGLPNLEMVHSIDRRVGGVGASLDEFRDQTREEFKEITEKYALKEDVKDFKNEIKRDIEKVNVKMDELLTEVRASAMQKKGR